MALDELHARRLATLMNVFQGALDRIDLLLEGVDESGSLTAPQLSTSQLHSLKLATHQMRQRLRAAAQRFEVQSTRPHWRQQLAAELSTLWVVLENAKPERMMGYGRRFTTHDRADWEALIQDLLHTIDDMRDAAS